MSPVLELQMTHSSSHSFPDESFDASVDVWCSAKIAANAEALGGLKSSKLHLSAT